MSLAFAITAVAGIVVSNFSTYSAVRLLGFKSTIGYAGVATCTIIGDDTFYIRSLKKYEYEIDSGLSFPDKAKFDAIRTKINKRATIVYLAAPLVTTTIGTIFFLTVFKRYRKRKLINGLTFKDWLYVFLSFFWGRELLVFVLFLKFLLAKNSDLFFIDELQVLEINHFPMFPFISLIGIFSVFVLSSTIFIFLPKKQRFVFILSACFGSVLGFIVWVFYLGQLILP